MNINRIISIEKLYVSGQLTDALENYPQKSEVRRFGVFSLFLLEGEALEHAGRGQHIVRSI